MSKSSSLLFSAALFLAVPAATVHAAPPFEGELEMKLTAKAGGSGQMKVSVSKLGVRNQMDIQTPVMPMKMSMLFRHDSPNVAYTIDDATKTYGEIDLKKSREMAGPAKKFTAKKLGKEKVNGYDTVHALVTDDEGRETEVWTNKNDILDWKTFIRAMGKSAPADENMLTALEAVGADGFFVKLIVRPKAGAEDQMSMELVKASKKSLPASLFEIPKDYKKKETPAAGPGGQLPPEVQRQMMEKLKNLTPEQQEQLRRAMEKQSH